jgi:hypothetical protein
MVALLSLLYTTNRCSAQYQMNLQIEAESPPFFSPPFFFDREAQAGKIGGYDDKLALTLRQHAIDLHSSKFAGSALIDPAAGVSYFIACCKSLVLCGSTWELSFPGAALLNCAVGGLLCLKNFGIR